MISFDFVPAMNANSTTGSLKSAGLNFFSARTFAGNTIAPWGVIAQTLTTLSPRPGAREMGSKWPAPFWKRKLVVLPVPVLILISIVADV